MNKWLTKICEFNRYIKNALSIYYTVWGMSSIFAKKRGFFPPWWDFAVCFLGFSEQGAPVLPAQSISWFLLPVFAGFSPISDNTSAGLLYAFRIQYTLQDSRRCRPYNGYSLHSRQAFLTLSGCYSSDISFRMFRRKYSRHGLQISYP